MSTDSPTKATLTVPTAAHISMRYKTTNKEFAAQDAHFKKCCNQAQILATSRQASKFRNNKGRAWQAHKKAS